MSEEQRDLLEKLQEIDFVLVELNLYLDTHPRDEQAREQYHDYARKRRKIAREYEEHFGPLMHFGQSRSTSRAWQKGPWPWEL
jgi:spore coat protein JB